jgi:hypothetical protein
MASVHSYRDLAVILAEIAQRLDEIRAKGSYLSSDARYRALLEAKTIVNVTLATINILALGEEHKVNLASLIGLVKGTTQAAANDIDNVTRASVVTLFQFKIETLFKNLLINLGMIEPPQGYYNIKHELFKRITLKDKERKEQSLEVLALIRNSLHSNGYHFGYKASCSRIELSGEIFMFEHTKQVNCAGWKHITCAINWTLTVIEEILDSPEICQLKSPLSDTFIGDY